MISVLWKNRHDIKCTHLYLTMWLNFFSNCYNTLQNFKLSDTVEQSPQNLNMIWFIFDEIYHWNLLLWVLIFFQSRLKLTKTPVGTPYTHMICIPWRIFRMSIIVNLNILDFFSSFWYTIYALQLLNKHTMYLHVVVSVMFVIFNPSWNSWSDRCKIFCSYICVGFVLIVF